MTSNWSRETRLLRLQFEVNTILKPIFCILLRMARQDDYIRTALRVPPDLHAKLHKAADENATSFNAEIVARLTASFDAPPDVAALRQEIERLKNAEPLHRLYVLLDAHGYPLSWSEIHELVSAIGRTGKLSAVEMEIQVITPDMESNSRRTKEAAALAKRLRAAGKSGPIVDAEANPTEPQDEKRIRRVRPPK